jgi:hypothetical protein
LPPLLFKSPVSKTGILSLDMSLSDQEIGSLHEIIEDVSVDVVGTAMENVMVYMLPYAISMLSQSAGSYHFEIF